MAAVIVVDPTAIRVIVPSLATVATVGSLLLYTTSLAAALGVTVSTGAAKVSPKVAV